MQLTKGAIGNLINRYTAVLKKCRLMNTFGSLAVAGMLVMGGAGVTVAAERDSITDSTIITEDTTVQPTNNSSEDAEERKAGILSEPGSVVDVSIADGNTLTVSNRGTTATSSAKRIYGTCTQTGSSLNIKGDIQFTLEGSDDQQVRVIRANGGNTSLMGNVQISGTTTNNALTGIDIWNDANVSINSRQFGINLSSTTGDTTGIRNNGSTSGSILNINSDKISINIFSKNTTKIVQGLVANKSTTIFNGDTEINVIGGTYYSDGVFIQCDAGDSTNTNVNFLGKNTSISVISNGGSYGITVSGEPGGVKFNNGSNLIISTISNEKEAVGLLSQYGSHLNVDAVTNVTAKGKISACAIAIDEYASYAGNATFTDDLTAYAEAEGEASAIHNLARETETIRDTDGKLNAYGNVSLTAKSAQGNAFGVHSQGKYAEVNLRAGGKTVSVLAEGKNAYGLYSLDAGKIDVSGRDIDITAKGESASYAVAVFDTASVSLGSFGDQVFLSAEGAAGVGILAADNGSTVTLNGDTTIKAEKGFAGNGNITNKGNLNVTNGSFADFTGTFTQAAGATSLGKANFNGQIDVKGGSLNVNGELTLGNNLTVGDGSSVTVADTGKLIINSGTTTFEDNSLFAVNGNALTGNNAAITVESGGTLTVENNARLRIDNAKSGQTFNIVDGEGTADRWTRIEAGTDLLTPEMDQDGHVTFKRDKDASEVFKGMDGDTAAMLNTLIDKGLNNTAADEMGVRFLSRATDNNFLGMDKKAADESIQSAARIAFAGAAPQMTKMASDAATNAVVNRLGFANPVDGAQAINSEGKIVDRNTTGFALWIAPLWQSRNGWGLEAGNMDYGFNGNLGGVSLGADYTFENALRAGITFNIGGGYAESSGGDLSSTENRMNFWGLGAYAGWNYENFGVMADVSYTSTWNQLKQDLDSRLGMGNELEADVRATAISAGLRAEYLLRTGVLDIIPHIGVRYMSLNTWGYDVEADGGNVLEGDSLHQDIWTFPVGVTFSKEFATDSGWNFKPSLDFTVIPAAGDIEARHDVRFTGLPGTYEVETQMMDYLTWQGGVGLELANDNMSIGVNYTLQAGEHTTGHGVFGSFRYEF